MKVLIISAEVWQDGRNGGNVLSNIFGNSDWEFAQIYCNPGTPQNSICKKYYQMTDGMVLRNFFLHKPIGNEFVLKDSFLDNENKVEQPKKRFYSFFHKFRLNIFYSFKGILWNFSNWKNKKLKAFLDNYNPDIIFAPCYGSTFMLKLTRFVAKYTGKKVISYISDDSYTLKQFNLSPIYWLNRFAVRRQMRKTFPYYSLCYTMTESQKKQCEKDFSCNMKILLKGNPFDISKEEKDYSLPIKLVYAGGIYLNRWKTLEKIALAIKKINEKETKLVLDIYTGNEVSRRIAKNLNDGKNSTIHGLVSLEELKKIYKESHVAIHLESFDLKNRLQTRFSFSTKIVDCLASSCAVLAICDEKQSGLIYLKENDAAICITNPNDILKTLEDLSSNTSIIKDYANKATTFCLKNHNLLEIRQSVKKDFYDVLGSDYEK